MKRFVTITALAVFFLLGTLPGVSSVAEAASLRKLAYNKIQSISQKSTPRSIQRATSTSSLQGTIQTVIVETFPTSYNRYYLKQSNGNSIELIGAGIDALDAYRGATVRIQGASLSSGKALLPAISDDVISIISQPQRSSQHRSSTQVKKLAVIMANFQNDTSQPFTQSFLEDKIFTGTDSTNAFYNEMSGGKLAFEGVMNQTGDFYGWYTLPTTNAGCATYTWAGLADAEAIAATGGNFDPDDYDHIMYVFPDMPSCTFAGLGTVGVPGITLPSPELVWMTTNSTQNFANVATHEIGHNLGLQHASNMACHEHGSNTHVDGDCVFQEYGDLYDVMGGDGPLDGYKLEVLDFIAGNDIQEITTSGTYTVHQLLNQANTPRVLKLPISKNTQGKTVEYYSVEYREVGNFGNNNPGVIQDGVFIRKVGNPDGIESITETYLIDSTPATYQNFYDAAFKQGDSFRDNLLGITITIDSVVSGSATVIVSYDPGFALCTRNQPSISFVPGTLLGPIGTIQSTVMTLTNNDTANCHNSRFDFELSDSFRDQVTFALSPGWNVNPGKITNHIINPGQSTSITYNVTPGSQAVNGNGYRSNILARSIDSLGSSNNTNVTQTTLYFDIGPEQDQQIIPLDTGWNLVSTFIAPIDTDIENIFSDIVDDIVIVKNSAGQAYVPSFGINQIGNWEPDQGYSVKISAPANLVITGQKIDPTTGIDLTTGWNLVPYYHESPMAADVALASITGDIAIVKDILGRAYIPSFGINTIGDLIPGQAYKIKVSTNTTLTYPGP